MANLKRYNNETKKWEVVGGIPIDKSLTNSNIAADAKAVGDRIGDITGLTTNSKTNLVSAINEVKTVAEESSDIIISQPEPPEDKTKIWLDTDDDVNIETIGIDKTLSMPDMAADAKAVGDRFKTAVLFTPQDLTEEQKKQAQKNIGAQPIGNYAKTEDIPQVPAWAMESQKPTYTAEEVKAEPTGTSASTVSAHNISRDAHNDIRDMIAGLTRRLDAFFNSDDQTLDQLSEIVEYIKANKSLIDSITTSKVNVTDIIDNLTTNVATKPLSAAQGVELKRLIDAIVIPDVPAWAMTPNKPTYTATEVKARPDTWVPTAEEVGALPDNTKIPIVPGDIGAQPAGDYALKSEIPQSAYQDAKDGGYTGTEESFPKAFTNALDLPPAITRVDSDGVNMMQTESELGYWNGTVGEFPKPVSASYFCRTPKPFDVTQIPIKGGYRYMWLTAQNATADSVRVLCLDSSGKIVFVSNTSIFPKEIYAPKETTSCLFYASDANQISQYCISNRNSYTEYTGGKGKVLIRADAIDPDFSANKPLTGKTVAFLGDSMFGMWRGDTGAPAYAGAYSGVNAVNCGFSGCKMASGGAYLPYEEAFAMNKLADSIFGGDWTIQENQIASSPGYFREQLDNLKNVDWANAYGMVIHYGTNDFSTSGKLDNPENQTDISTICGSLRYSLNKIMVKFPKLKIFVSLPCYRVWKGDLNEFSEDKIINGIKLSDICNALVNVAREYNIPVIDSYHGLGVNRQNWAAYLEDGLHHTQIGRESFGLYMGQCLVGGADGFGFYGTGEGVSASQVQQMIDASIGKALEVSY